MPFIGSAQSVSVTVEQLQEITSVTPQFNYLEQLITGLSLDSMFIRDTIVVYSKNIDFKKADFNLLFEGKKCKVTEVWKDSIECYYSGSYDNYEKSEFEITAIVTDYETKNIFKTAVKYRGPFIGNPEKKSWPIWMN